MMIEQVKKTFDLLTAINLPTLNSKITLSLNEFKQMLKNSNDIEAEIQETIIKLRHVNKIDNETVMLYLMDLYCDYMHYENIVSSLDEFLTLEIKHYKTKRE